jgi:photosystem II stability/assembly factor-like uncharacterized protein
MKFMRKIFIILTLAVICQPTIARWKKIADFKYESSFGDSVSELITCVYFIDLPGPLRVGFVGTESELWKTTNGGISWSDVTPSDGIAYVCDICFKDSLTGWCLGLGGIGGEVFKTDDGGETWTLQYATRFATNGIHYCMAPNRLLLTTGDSLLVSTNLGNSWSATAIEGAYFAFNSDSMGIVSASFAKDTTCGFFRTTNAGVSWDRADITFDTFVSTQPLAIPGTPICFAATYDRVRVYRSDNYGQTWRQLVDFGPNMDSQFQEIGPVGTGYIRGDLSRLYIGSDSGMYVSTDSGVTWTNDGGPPDQDGGYPHEFYAGNGITMEGWWGGTNDVESLGLWEEDWAQAAVAESTTSDSSCFSVVGPYSNPSEPLSDDVSILVHYCGTSSTISAQVYTMMGVPIGLPSTYTSDGQTWDRLPINAPPISGTYYITVTVGGYSTALGYVVF